MIWTWPPWRRHKEAPEESDQNLATAREAREHAEETLARVRGQRPEVERMVRALQRIRSRNHLIEIVEESIRERRDDRG